MPTDLVLAEPHDGVLIITINRSAQKNAVNHEVAVQLAAAVDRLDADPHLSVGVLTGAGGTFCAGMDLKAFAAGEVPTLPGRGFGGLTRATVRKPLIAAVEGWALGGGFELALACDLIVAAEDAKFGFPEVTRGLVASEGGLIRLPQRVPYHVALRVLLTGEPLPAAEAGRFGLVTTLTASGAALDEARELATRVARNAPLALAAVKRIVRAAEGLDDEDAFAAQDPLVAGLIASDDAHEGARAFKDKRAPVWHGR
ncbi:crotonase/enoyl-CoA hydratase family protein [Solirubrobacter ginsenosidimutans]|uniref:Crotonase/enoyl-CoA hydratase family protein n=1 Tax=Solirubrobacter ginsenosidimutans TaxID=490573 RepID=A0A9X3S180_9ACTN|nr:crotonase/enoyl-CoA hydratase family protein [Solirubrobacter ginsenosidimutans]MDA0159886.1 crotonase/enoyl-CoA hydratase family protein [Solirubrobacter ginsenosidimutans]